jgi:hypothetical protein
MKYEKQERQRPISEATGMEMQFQLLICFSLACLAVQDFELRGMK